MNIKQIVLASRPHGLPTLRTFRFEEAKLRELNEGEVLLKPWFFSVDPYMRGRMNNVKSYADPFEENKPIIGRTISRIIETKSKIFAKGDIVVGTLPWATYTIEKAENIRIIDPQVAPPSYYLGILGMPGLTAYFGMMEIGKPKVGETVVVSGAAGAVGIVAGQIAKIQGSRVIGISGSDEKCKMLKEQFGFDETMNYKSSRIKDKDIATICPRGVDVYYDNVGGEITEAVIPNLNFHSRFAVCGQISQYNNTEEIKGPNILPFILTRSILIQGFIVGNYSSRFGEGFAHLIQWVKEGKLKYKETIIHGFDKLPEAFLGLFSGENMGKMLIEIE
jgi:NADPH:quinone reductase